MQSLLGAFVGLFLGVMISNIVKGNQFLFNVNGILSDPVCLVIILSSSVCCWIVGMIPLEILKVWSLLFIFFFFVLFFNFEWGAFFLTASIPGVIIENSKQKFN